MPVFNARPYLDKAIESILEQSFADFEFIIGDNCSTDGSWDRILHHARRDQRMDADDIAHRDRLRTQMALAAAHPGAVLIGSLFDVLDGTGRVVRTSRLAQV